MPGTAIGTQENLGYPGTYSRNTGGLNIAARLVTPADTANINFGDAVVMNANGAQASQGGNYSQLAGFIAGGGTATMSQGNGAFVGFAVREVKTNLTYAAAPSALATLGYYAPGELCDVIEQGAVTVTYGNPKSAAAPVAGGPVFIRTSTNGTGTVVGTIEPAADSGHTLALTNCVFTTGLISTDASGNQVIEVTLLTRNQP
jgi:hypothetical protein